MTTDAAGPAGDVPISVDMPVDGVDAPTGDSSAIGAVRAATAIRDAIVQAAADLSVEPDPRATGELLSVFSKVCVSPDARFAMLADLVINSTGAEQRVAFNHALWAAEKVDSLPGESVAELWRDVIADGTPRQLEADDAGLITRLNMPATDRLALLKQWSAVYDHFEGPVFAIMAAKNLLDGASDSERREVLDWAVDIFATEPGYDNKVLVVDLLTKGAIPTQQKIDLLEYCQLATTNKTLNLSRSDTKSLRQELRYALRKIRHEQRDAERQAQREARRQERQPKIGKS